VFPGARELLRRLTAIGLPWTIATSGERAQVQKLVKGLALPKPSSAAQKKRTIARLPKSVRTALGKKGAQAAKRKRC